MQVTALLTGERQLRDFSGEVPTQQVSKSLSRRRLPRPSRTKEPRDFPNVSPPSATRICPLPVDLPSEEAPPGSQKQQHSTVRSSVPLHHSLSSSSPVEGLGARRAGGPSSRPEQGSAWLSLLSRREPWGAAALQPAVSPSHPPPPGQKSWGFFWPQADRWARAKLREWTWNEPDRTRLLQCSLEESPPPRGAFMFCFEEKEGWGWGSGLVAHCVSPAEGSEPCQ